MRSFIFLSIVFLMLLIYRRVVADHSLARCNRANTGAPAWFSSGLPSGGPYPHRAVSSSVVGLAAAAASVNTFLSFLFVHYPNKFMQSNGDLDKANKIMSSMLASN